MTEVILTITSKRDGHIDKVADHLDAIGAQWVRINTEDFAKNVDLTVDPVSGASQILVKDSKRCFDMGSVKAVWYRKPDPLDLSHFELDRISLDYVEAEFNEVLQGCYALLKGAFWINNPLTSRLAHRKMLQLQIAGSLGFRVPRTIVTNSIRDALAFAESVNWDVAIKSLGAISVSSQRNDAEVQYGVYTRRVGMKELLALQDKIPYMPTLFQEYISKEYEMRVTCVGQQIFACRIFSQENERTLEDYRFDVRDLRHELCSCQEIADKLLAYLRAFNINFGCFDFAVTKTGEFVFFECNPNGQWLWIEELTGATISQSIADLLVSNG